MQRSFIIFGATCCLSLFSNNLHAGELIINSFISEEAAKKDFLSVIDSFQTEYPSIKVKVNTTDHEAYKTQVRSMLTLPKGKAPDLVTWFASERMRYFARRGLVLDLSDVWENENLNEKYSPSIANALKMDGTPYGVCVSGYTWGLYFRKDILEKLKLNAPTSFESLLNTCKTLKANGYVPLTLGSKYLWTTAGYFDILNLRINGYDFHTDWLQGKISFTDERVRKVFDHLKLMMDHDCFNSNHAALSWNESSSMLNINTPEPNQAVMNYMGMFISFALSPETQAVMDLVRFPAIDTSMPAYEDIPTDTTYMIPKNATNVEEAKLFLSFLIKPEVVNKLSGWQIPLIKGAKITDTPLNLKAQELLKNTVKSTEFLDRDMNPQMATAVMEALTEFMAKPDQIDNILTRLESTRRRIYQVN